MFLLKHGYVKFNAGKFGTFRIDVPDENLGHTVRLFPKPECSCINGSITTNCHHIMAVQIGCGLSEDQRYRAKKKANITLFRQRALNRKLRNAGKKVSTRRDLKTYDVSTIIVHKLFIFVGKVSVFFRLPLERRKSVAKNLATLKKQRRQKIMITNLSFAKAAKPPLRHTLGRKQRKPLKCVSIILLLKVFISVIFPRFQNRPKNIRNSKVRS